jgi:hypothetical protein
MTMIYPTHPHCTVWQSHAHAIAIKADPSYPTFVQDRESLVTAPVYEAHVPFSENLQRILGAPVTQISIYKVDDGEINPNAMPVAETQELVRHAMRRKESLQAPGFIALSWGVTIEDGTRGIHLAGWRSVEVRLRSLSLLVFSLLSCKRLNGFFL